MVASENRGSNLTPGVFHTFATQPGSPQKPVHPRNGKGQQQVPMSLLLALPGWGHPAECHGFDTRDAHSWSLTSGKSQT